MLVKDDNNKTKEVDISEVTAKNYIVPQGEENTYHCKIEIKQFDSTTGKQISKARIQKYNAKMFESVILTNLHHQGYSVEILYNPTAWLQKQKELQKKILESEAKEIKEVREVKKEKIKK